MRDERWNNWQDQLFQRVSTLPQQGLDDATRRRAMLVLVDDLAAMVAALDDPEVHAIAGSALRLAPQTESRLVTGGRAGRTWAALVNAVAACWNELDEGYRPATAHGGLYALPAAMAEAEASGQSVGQLLQALVGGYEVATAYARAVAAPKPLVWHPHATLSAVGSATAIAVARGGDQNVIASAAQVAATLSAAGPFSHAPAGALVRNAWAGHGALTGFSAVEFQAAGMLAHAESPLEVLRGLGGELVPGELDTLSTQWAIHEGYHKQYACCQYLHSALEAALDLANGALTGNCAADIESIEVQAHPLAMPLDDQHPQTTLGGKFSMPHVVATVLAARSTGPEVFGGVGLTDPTVAALRERVSIVEYDGDLTPPFDRPAVVKVTVQSGKTFSSTCRSAVGGPDRPLSEEQVLEKADALTRHRAPRFSRVAAGLLDGNISESAAWSDVLEELWGRSA